jgi:hypothetical protein
MKNIYLIGFAVALIAVAFFVGKCSNKTDNQTALNNLIASRDSVKQSYVVIDGLKNTVFTKDAIILTKDDALKAQVIENARLKALHIKELVTNTELSGVIHVLRDSLNLPVEPTYITVKDTSGISRNYIRIPFDLIKTHETYLDLDAGMRENKKAWFDLSVPVSGELSVGYVGTGFLRLKQKPVGIFTSKNPYLKITDMDVLIIKENKKFYQKTWFHMLGGAVLFEGTRLLLTK